MEVAACASGAADDYDAAGSCVCADAFAGGAGDVACVSCGTAEWRDDVGGCRDVLAAVGNRWKRRVDDGVYLARAEARAVVCWNDDVCGAGDCAAVGNVG